MTKKKLKVLKQALTDEIDAKKQVLKNLESAN
jgi:hypothetical protein